MEIQMELRKEVQRKFHQAFESGLIAEFGAVVGEILNDVSQYYGLLKLEGAALVNERKADGEKVETAVASNSVDGGTMWLIRANTAASALLLDVVETQRWAALGLELCQTIQDGGWHRTEHEWRWILENTEEYLILVVELKKFLRHV
jgi:hypothetical protein